MNVIRYSIILFLFMIFPCHNIGARKSSDFIYPFPELRPDTMVINGLLADSVTNLPVCFADIYFGNNSTFTKSNPGGEFMIPSQAVPATLKIRKSGYKEKIVSITSSAGFVKISLRPIEIHKAIIFSPKRYASLLKTAVEKLRKNSAFAPAERSTGELVYCRITSSVDSTINTLFESYAQMNINANSLGDYQSRVARYVPAGERIPGISGNRLSFSIDPYIRIPFMSLERYVKNRGSFEQDGKNIAIVSIVSGYTETFYYIDVADSSLVHITRHSGPGKSVKLPGPVKTLLDKRVTTTEISFSPPDERSKSCRIDCVIDNETFRLKQKKTSDRHISKTTLFTVIPDSSLITDKINEYLFSEALVEPVHQINYNAKFSLSGKISFFDSETQKLLLKPYNSAFWVQNALIKPVTWEQKQIKSWEDDNRFYSEKSFLHTNKLNEVDTLVKKLNSNIVFVENVYLEPDRPDYLTGDTIWFSAFVMDNLLMDSTSLSSILYVDLINAQNKLEKRLKLLIKNGRASGDFILGKELKSGIFRIRAYTQWMRNFQGEYLFEKEIPVYQSDINNLVVVDPVINRSAEGDSVNIYLQALLPSKYKTPEKKLDLFIRLNDSLNVRKSFNFRGDFRGSLGFFVPSSFSISSADIKLTLSDTGLISEQRLSLPLKPGIDLQFFPESGKMVAGIETAVAYKAVDNKGNPAAFDADIADENQKIITQITGNKSGIGKFNITPEPDRSYNAIVNITGTKYIFKLPQIESTGYVITYDADSSLIYIKKSSGEDKSRHYLLASMRGGIFDAIGLTLNPEALKVRIPFSTYPKGIVQITLFDSLYRPLAERLVFNNRPDKKMLIHVETGKNRYKQREKVNLTISVTDASGNPVESSLAMSVVDALKTDTLSSSDIESYLYLASELKGKIDNRLINLADTTTEGKSNIDLVMMTRGWRNYLWNSIRYRSSLAVVYPAEKGFYLDGTISTYNSRMPAGEYRLNFFDTKSGFTDIINVNERGGFRIGFPFFYDTHSLMIQNRNSKSMIDDVRFILDTVPVPGIDLRNNELLYAMYKPGYLKTINEKFAEKDTTSVPDKYIMLKEVIVKARRSRVPDSKPDKTVNLAKTDPTGKKYGSLMQMIREEFGDKAFIDTRGKPCSPILVANGNEYDNKLGGNSDKIELYSLALKTPVNEISNVKLYGAGSDYSQFLTPPFPMDLVLKFFKSDISPFAALKMAEMGFKIPSHIKELAGRIMEMAWGDLPVVSFTTSYNFYRGDPKGTIRVPFQGIYQAREFYQPNYENNKANKIDKRTTIYWNPEVKTDSTGKAHVSFYNSDLKGKALIRISGVSYQLRDAATVISNYGSN